MGLTFKSKWVMGVKPLKIPGWPIYQDFQILAMDLSVWGSDEEPRLGGCHGASESFPGNGTAEAGSVRSTTHRREMTTKPGRWSI